MTSPAPRGTGTVTALWRQTLAGLRVLLAFTVVLGVAYPLLVTGIAQIALPWQANGSLVTADGAHTDSRDEAAGSAIIGQSFGTSGKDPEWFHPRPSVSGYDTLASGGSNLGPNSAELSGQVAERRALVAAADGVDPADVPPDALTASSSGLDPHISPAYAAEQVDRVATARGLDAARVRSLVAEHTQGRDLGFLGEPRVNVLELNLALAGLG